MENISMNPHVHTHMCTPGLRGASITQCSKLVKVIFYDSFYYYDSLLEENEDIQYSLSIERINMLRNNNVNDFTRIYTHSCFKNKHRFVVTRTISKWNPCLHID